MRPVIVHVDGAGTTGCAPRGQALGAIGSGRSGQGAAHEEIGQGEAQEFAGCGPPRECHGLGVGAA